MHPAIIAASFACAAVVSAACCGLRLLTFGGAIAAALVGGTILAFGGWPAGAALLAFFATSNLLGRWRRSRKKALGFEKGDRRDAAQVLANGAVAAIMCLAAALAPHLRAEFDIGCLAALAEANADTWATEVGAASGAIPRSISTLRPAAPGMSGAISAPGTTAAVAGAALIGVFSLPIVPRGHAVQQVAIAAASGVLGCLADSLLGATVQAQYAPNVDGTDHAKLSERRSRDSRLARGVAGIGNDAVNLAATALSAAIAILLSSLA